MNKPNSRLDSVVRKEVRSKVSVAERRARPWVAAALGASFVLFTSDNQHAQQRFKEPVVRITEVTCGAGAFSIVADDSLSHAQTWQDAEAFHVVLVNGQAAFASASCGVKVRHIGNSLELVVPVRAGASVTVNPRGNRLDLVVSGGSSALSVENFPVEGRAKSSSREKAERRGEEEQQAEYHEPKTASKRRGSQESAPAEAQAASQHERQPQQTQAQPQPAQKSDAASGDLVNLSAPTQKTGTPEGVENSAPPPPPATAAELNAGHSFDPLSFLTSLPTMLVALAMLLAGAAVFVIRRRGAASAGEDEEAVVGKKKKSKVAEGVANEEGKPFEQSKGDRRKASIAVPFERRTAGHGAEDEASRRLLSPEEGQFRAVEHSTRAKEPKAEGHAAQAEQFGAYRVDQEVSRLVQGKSHSVEVIASRAADDRRAVETSLLKALRSSETGEDGLRRVRMALEDYGFVARSCASLLLGGESFERASSARTLGEMKSAQALPFLTEALYDPDPVVRTECVQSLGALGFPSAIGALLDVARRHPDIPPAILGPALTSCSVESVELNFGSPFEGRTFADAADGANSGEGFFTYEVNSAAPAYGYEELPEWVEDGTLSAALEQLRSTDVETRVRCAQQLAQFQVRRAVDALASLARNDGEPAVRSAAVTSLGLVGHESVFVPVIVGLADEAREVRAASARALSRLSFDRAEGYVRVIETADEQTLRTVASACAKAGLASQAISRLASEDRRQSYEAYSLLSLCAKAGETQPLLDTVECHRDIEVRLACVNLLGLSTQPDLAEQLMRIAGNGGVPERVRRALIEAVSQAAQPQPVAAS